MKRMYLFSLTALLLFLSCGKEDPGQINLSLNLNSTVTQTIQDSINQFVFIIGKTGSAEKLLYPSACLGCSSNTTPCPVADQCLKSTDCGFPASAETFDPQINFADVAKGENMDVIACALDNTSTPVAAGQGQVRNEAGAEEAITMTANATICINNLPSEICAE
jgi:hypothetical protein